MKLTKILAKAIRKSLNEQDSTSNVDAEQFEDALSKLATLDLEDDQVRIPTLNDELDSYIFQIGKIYIYIRNKDDMPSSGPFELFILDVDDDTIGFIRGTVSNKVLSFNLIYLIPEKRGWGYGYDIYEHFLNDGYTVKSDSEITDGTYSLYLKLLKNGFTPIIFDDGRVGLKK